MMRMSDEGQRRDGANGELLGEAFCIFGAEKEREERLHVLVKRGCPITS